MFFFSSPVRDGKDGFLADLRKFDEAFFDLVLRPFGPVGRDSNVPALVRRCNHFTYGTHAAFFMRAANSSEAEETDDPGDKLSVAVAGYEDFRSHRPDCEGHQKQPPMPEAGNHIAAALLSLQEMFSLDVSYAQRGAQRQEKEIDQRREDSNEEKAPQALTHSLASCPCV